MGPELMAQDCARDCARATVREQGGSLVLRPRRVVTPAATNSMMMPHGRPLVFLQALLALLLVQVHVHASYREGTGSNPNVAPAL